MNYQELEFEFNRLKKEHAKTYKMVGVILNNLPDYTNLKLYDVAYQMESDTDWALFKDFCFNEYDDYEYHLNLHDLAMEHVGRTSSFYIVPTGTQFPDFHTNYLVESYNVQTPYDIMYSSYYDCEFYGLEQFECCDTFGEWLDNMNGCDIELNDIESLEIEIDGVESEILLCREHIKELIQELRHVRKQGYNYIQDFKNNQLEIFNDYKENNEF